MKYTKPRRADSNSVAQYLDSVDALLDSLPDSFEIVPEGHVCVKWPNGYTQREIRRIVGQDVMPTTAQSALLALAAIAPEEKKPEKRRVYILQFQGHGENHGRLELSFNANPQFPFIKVGECEVSE